MVTGTGLVNRMHSSGEAGDFLPLDYRVYASDQTDRRKSDQFLALSAPCIYHASEAKQYSTELFAAVLALLFYTRYSAARHVGSFVVWGLLGALLLAFSFSVIFVLVSMAFVVCINLALKKQWNRLLALVAFSVWAVGFAL